MRTRAMLLAAGLWGCDVAATTQEATHEVVQGTVEVARGIGSGIVEGAREGREGTPSTDGARVVGTFERFSEVGAVSIRRVMENAGRVQVTFHFTNRTDVPIRVAHLDDNGMLLALDREHVARQVYGTPPDAFTVFPTSAHSLDVTFDMPAADAASVRIWGHELALPAP